METKSLMLLLLLGFTACAPSEEPVAQEQKKPPAALISTVKTPKADARPWKIPTTLPPGPQGKTIQWGETLIAETPKHLGPDMVDVTKRYAGNRLSCKSCHLNAGKQANAMGFVGITARFPMYRGRENRQVTLQERINGCFERSLNGKALPVNSPEMKAIVAYMHWLSQDYPQGVKVNGQGIPPIVLFDRATSPAKGKGIYAAKCALCHQANGAGLPLNAAKPQEGYLYPALWGSDSFNNGAGMGRVITAAKFIKANMPLGNANLSAAEALDVAAYINSQKRPIKAGLEQDYPDRSKKPVDVPYPPWVDSFSPEQHTFGPFKPMMKGKETGS